MRISARSPIKFGVGAALFLALPLAPPRPLISWVDRSTRGAVYGLREFPASSCPPADPANHFLAGPASSPSRAAGRSSLVATMRVMCFARAEVEVR